MDHASTEEFSQLGQVRLDRNAGSTPEVLMTPSLSLSRSLFHPCSVWRSSQTENTLKSNTRFWHYFKPLSLVLLSR